MGTKRCILFAGPPVIVIGLLVWYLLFPHGPTEPVYKGMRLSGWLQNYNPNFTAIEDDPFSADFAVRQMGTNAIPTLLRMLRAKDSSFKIKMEGFLLDLRLVSTPSAYQAEKNIYATYGFRILGAEARNAVPDLIKIFEENISELSQGGAAQSLGDIGPEAKPAVPALLSSLTNINVVAGTRMEVLVALGKIHSEPELVVPVLIGCLTNTRPIFSMLAMNALEDYGPAAQLAVPNLLEILNGTNDWGRVATRVLKKIDPEAAAKAEVK